MVFMAMEPMGVQCDVVYHLDFRNEWVDLCDVNGCVIEFEFAMRFLDLVNSGLIRDYATNLRGLIKFARGGRISCSDYELRAMLTYDRETVTCHWVL